jgi:N-acetylmuramoyl-L-alanine amidase
MTDHHRLLPPRLSRPGNRIAILASCLVTAGCVAISGCTSAGSHPAAPSPQRTATSHTPVPAPSTTASDPPASPSGTPSTAAKPLAGKVVGIDPGHNGRNGTDPAYLDRQIWNGRESEDCDTTGTETDAGYTEALFNFRVARFLRADLVRDGARVVLTRPSNHGIGPCVTRRAEILNNSGANVAIDIHADGGPPSGRGFAILEPVSDGPNDTVITSSERFGRDVRRAFLTGTSMPTSTYDGYRGITQRDDLAGLNLTRVPKVLIECGNMRNATDARLLTSASFQRQAARALTAAIIRFLR